MTQTKIASELSSQALADNADYDAMEIGHAMTENISNELWESINKHRDLIDQDEFCVVMLIGRDNLLHNLIRRKFYCWPFLPKPRPNQAVFLYNKRLDKITKRLWVLPSAKVMSEISTLQNVSDRYKTMQAWSIAFFEGTFWNYIRYEHDIKMLSECEYFSAHRDELLKSGTQDPDAFRTQPFDFSKISAEKIVDPQDAILSEYGLNRVGQTQNGNREIGSHTRHEMAI